MNWRAVRVSGWADGPIKPKGSVRDIAIELNRLFDSEMAESIMREWGDLVYAQQDDDTARQMTTAQNLPL
jgi:hypothetical protein